MLQDDPPIISVLIVGTLLDYSSDNKLVPPIVFKGIKKILEGIWLRMGQNAVDYFNSKNLIHIHASIIAHLA
jgi:hypothetical protein